MKRLQDWLQKKDSGLLFLLSEFLPCGVVIRGACILNWKTDLPIWILADVSLCAIIAALCVLVTKQLLGEQPTNWQRLKAIAVELAIAYVIFAL